MPGDDGGRVSGLAGLIRPTYAGGVIYVLFR